MASKLTVSSGDLFEDDKIQTLTGEKPWMKDRILKCAETIEEVRAFVDKAINTETNPSGKCVLDLETTGLSSRVKKVFNSDGQPYYVPVKFIVGFCLSYDSKFGFYIPIRHWDDPKNPEGYNLPQNEVLGEIKRLCEFCITIYQNAKFDLQFLRNYGICIIDYKKFEDTLLKAHLYDPGQKDNKLKHLSERLLNQPMIEFSDITGKEKRFDLLDPRKVGYVYGSCDGICTLDLNTFFDSQEIVQNQKFIYDVERKVTLVVMEMEANLIKLDVPYLKSLKERTETRIKEIEKQILTMAGRDINIASPKQLGDFLFDEQHYTYPEKSKTASGKQYSTADATLEKIADLYPIVKRIMEYRGLEKVLGTYICKLLSNYDEEECIKLCFNQSGTDTGRFSSPGGKGIDEDGYSGTNVQSIPKKPDDDNPWMDMRKAFVPRPGMTMVAADYENEEMRIATNYSLETKWIDAVKNDIDFHTATGAIIAGGKDTSQVTPAERKLGKTTNFLALYLGGPMTLAAKAKISINEAKKVLATFWEGVPRLKKWKDTEIIKARKLKYVKTALGRIRLLDKLYSTGDRMDESHADRCAINTQIQGTAADIMKIVMTRVYQWIHLSNLQDDVRLLITMHDELVFEIRNEILEECVPYIARIMMLPEVIEDKLHWPVPLTVDVKFGESWRTKKTFFKEFPQAKEKLNELLKSKTVELFSKTLLKSRYDLILNKEPSPVFQVPEPQIVVPEVSQESESQIASKVAVDFQEPPVPQVQDQKMDAQTINVPIPVEQLPEKVVEKKETDIDKSANSGPLVYTVRDRRDVTLRHLNDIVRFFVRENKRGTKYFGAYKVLRVRDTSGNNLSVEEIDVPEEAFLALARFFEI